MSIIETIILAIVEGITEFLPISSTGHMIIASKIMGIEKNEFTKLLEVAIQFGAILAVVVLYAKKFFQFTNWQFYAKLVIGVLPALVLGYLFSNQIDSLLESPLTVAITLIAGGIVLLFIDKLFKNPTKHTDDEISYGNAFTVGLWQTIAMIPGVSRSAASIIGGMQQKFTRNLAAEFSFFLAVPTMFAATAYSVFLKHYDVAGEKIRGIKLILANSQNVTAFILGNIIAFIVAIIAIKFFIGYLQKHGFKLFGWYRIIMGTIILSLLLTHTI